LIKVLIKVKDKKIQQHKEKLMKMIKINKNWREIENQQEIQEKERRFIWNY